MIINFQTGLSSRSETETARRVRIARERSLIDEGMRDLRGGRFVEGVELEAVLEAFEGDEPMPDRPSGQK